MLFHNAVCKSECFPTYVTRQIRPYKHRMDAFGVLYNFVNRAGIQAGGFRLQLRYARCKIVKSKSHGWSTHLSRFRAYGRNAPLASSIKDGPEGIFQFELNKPPKRKVFQMGVTRSIRHPSILTTHRFICINKQSATHFLNCSCTYFRALRIFCLRTTLSELVNHHTLFTVYKRKISKQ